MELLRLVFFPNSVRGHGDLLLAFCVLIWTIYIFYELYVKYQCVILMYDPLT